MDDPSDIGRMIRRLRDHPTPDALQEGSLAHWNFPKLGYRCREGALAVMLRTEEDTWQKHLAKVYKPF